MRVRTYEVFRRAVEEGVEYGWRRAHKHTDTPAPEHMKEQLINEVLNAVCECFTFDDDEAVTPKGEP